MKRFLLVLLLMAEVALAAQERVFLFLPEKTRERDANGENGELYFGNSHLQQRFDSSLFQLLIPKGASIELLGPRLDRGNPTDYMRDSSGIQIRFGIIPHDAGPLDPVFATNERYSQSGMTTVLEFADINRISVLSGQVSGEQRGYYTSLALSKPFFYDPRMGDLLVDLQVKAPTLLPALFDFDSEGGLGITSVFAHNTDEAPSKGIVKDGGFVFGFRMIPVPEPSSMALVGVGFAIAAVSIGSRPRGVSFSDGHRK